MAGTCIINLEGVLVKDQPPNGVPVWVGLQLYHALSSQFRLVLDSNHQDITDIEHWLQVNGLKRHTLILHRTPEQDLMGEMELRQVHLGEWRAHGFDVALYITADPQVAALMLSLGVPAMLLAHPAYARPEHRPGAEQGMRPWAEIEEELTETAKRKDHRVRIDAEMDSHYAAD